MSEEKIQSTPQDPHATHEPAAAIPVIAAAPVVAVGAADHSADDIDIDTFAEPPIVYPSIHKKVLAARGIPEDLAREYRIRPQTEKDTREGLGRQDIVGSSLRIPSTGTTVCPRFRLDRPEANGDVRYLTRKGSEIPPFVLRTVDRASRDAVNIVEAGLKALSMCAHGFPSTVGLGGVSAGAFLQGTRDLHPELRAVIPAGRRVNILFDANRLVKVQVAAAEARLACGLRAAGADVWLVQLPAAEKGKDGPDDFLVANGPDALRVLIAKAVPSDPVEWVKRATSDADAAELLRHLPFRAALAEADAAALDLVAAELRKHKISKGAARAAIQEFNDAVAAEAQTEVCEVRTQYAFDAQGRICLVRHEVQSGTEVLVPLANFGAKIVEEIVFDDGAERDRVFMIEGRLDDGTALPLARVRDVEYPAMQWVFREWGARAAPAAGKAAQDQLREAVQAMSKPTARTVYRHTGFRDVDGHYAFLYGGGALGAAGASVELAGKLANIALPPHSGDLTAAVQTALTMLDVGPDEIGAALFCAAALAPLSSILQPAFIIWLVGPTGSFKSVLAALAQSFFGERFDLLNLPGAWTSTENALEMQLFCAKDVLFVIDDFAPQQDFRAQRQMQEKAARIVRSVGNGASRSRLRADLTQRPDRPPRGLVVSTGEEMPAGASIHGRLLRVDVDKRSIDLAKVSHLQRNQRALSVVMREHVDAIRIRYAGLVRTLPQKFIERREEFVGTGSHMRHPAALAALDIGFEVFCDFLLTSLVASLDTVGALRARVRQALIRLGAANGAHQAAVCPSEVFLGSLRAMLSQGRAKLANKGTDLALASTSSCDAIGWWDDSYVYLEPVLAHQAVVKFCAVGQTHFTASLDQLKKLLDQRGLLVRPTGKSDKRLEVSIRVGPKRTERTIKLRAETLTPGVDPNADVDEVHAHPLEAVVEDLAQGEKPRPRTKRDDGADLRVFPPADPLRFARGGETS